MKLMLIVVTAGFLALACQFNTHIVSPHGGIFCNGDVNATGHSAFEIYTRGRCSNE